MINRCVRFFLTCVIAASPGAILGHGFDLSLTFDNSGNPTGITAASEFPGDFYDLYDLTPGPSNLFIEEFSGTPNPAAVPNPGAYDVIHGAPQTSGSWPPYTATVSIVTPLYFSDGSAVSATIPPAGTYINMYDRDVGQYPGASPGNVQITGQSSFEPGIGISLYDAHELAKDLIVGAGPTYGEYGFAMDVTVKFASGITLTTGPLVDVFAVSDPSLGDFADNASPAQQDAATAAIYRAAMADVSFDGIVNAQDIEVLASHWLQMGSIGQLPGDANRDGIVNGQDLALIAENWEGSSGGGAGAAAAVPEPAALCTGLVAVATALIFLRRSQRCVGNP
jgi:hypothetical protein